ncbi:MAG: ABC transporter ATP-binding protein [Planctomycetes bacterium]|nr:ABC transporter ATP-binding protein [Planctomycetota bacterium]
MIELIDVTRKYGEKTAVDNLSLAIPQGELFAFLGPNGAGKTTTIKMLVGLLRPTAGTVRVAGIDVVAQPREANRHVAYVPDEPHLYDKLTGREFLEFIAEAYGMSAPDAAAGMQEQIETFGLGTFVDQLGESYSHGMKQRLVFAAALLHRPQVLIVDEPMVGLDPRSMRMVKDLLRERARGGMTIFMSTHTLAVAEEIADRIGVVNHGRMAFLGTVAELQEHLALHERSLEDLYLTLTEE